MQDCFRQHPETYASEFEDDEEGVEDELRARNAASTDEIPSTPLPDAAKTPEPSEKVAPEASDSKSFEEPHRDSSKLSVHEVQKSGEEGRELVPKAVHDARL